MGVLSSLEAKLEGLVEGAFSRAFRSQVQPVELARKLAKEMDSHQTPSVQHVYVPNEYTIYLAPADAERFADYERSLRQELSSYLLEHARDRGYDLLTRPVVELVPDQALRLGEFGIQARMVRAPADEGEQPRQGEEGRTMVYSAVRPQEGAKVQTRAVVVLGDRRYVLEGPRAAIGRSRQCECVLRDPNISRRHAELCMEADGSWRIADLGSTNGIRVNGRRVDDAPLRPGDRVELGKTSFRFEVE